MRVGLNLKKTLVEVDQMSIDEIYLWASYLELYPSNDDNAEQYAAMIVQKIHNINAKKQDSLLQLKDIMPSARRKQREDNEALVKDGERLDRMFKEFTQNVGGTVIAPEKRD